jgi:NAD(P)-dependent dehydrogenase (short-subunit alcohol dehydrogenase family)
MKYVYDSLSLIVLGATSGIGRSLMQQLIASGRYPSLNLMLIARQEDKLRGVADELAQYASETAPQTELTLHTRIAAAEEDERIGAAVDDASKLFPYVDGAINLIGNIVLKPAHLTRIDEFKSIWGTHVQSSFSLLRHTAQAVLKSHQQSPEKEKRPTSIVLLSSCAASIGLPHHEAIASAKAAVQGLALSAAATYAKSGVRVNCVAPGLTNTPMASRLLAGPRMQQSAQMHPLGKVGTPEDVAHLCGFLLDSSMSGHITGQCIGVDGGFASLKV